MRRLGFAFSLMLVACSTTYRLQEADLERLKAGTGIAALRDEHGQSVDLKGYNFDYHVEGGQRPQRIKGIESLNGLAESGGLKAAVDLAAVPGRDNRAWQRIFLGGAVGLVAGAGIGFGITNRVATERAGSQGAACRDCSMGTVWLGTGIAGVLGILAGGVVAYFAGAGVGDTKPAIVDFLSGGAQ